MTAPDWRARLREAHERMGAELLMLDDVVKQAVEAEREACARECDALDGRPCQHTSLCAGPLACADAIRARGGRHE